MTNPDLKRTLDDMVAARTTLAARVAPLDAKTMALGAAGGWTVARTLQHVIEAEATYAKLLAHLTQGTAPGLATDEPSDGASAAAAMQACRDAVLALTADVDDETLYRLVRLGHEEYSVLSVLQNIASHDRDHLAQITELASRGDATVRRAPASVTVRPATAADAARLNEIYDHWIVNTAVTFDTDPWTLDQRLTWMSHYSTTGRHRLLVAEEGGVVLGYASTSPYHPRRAYETTVEMSIVCAHDAVGRGIGQRLYEVLFDAIRGEDIHVAVALITMPNRGSVALHERFGFETGMVLREAGRKFGAYHDVAYMVRRMGEA